MKKYFGITLGGLQKKTILLVLLVLLIAVSAAGGVAAYQNKMLAGIVEETRTVQQQAISQISEKTMDQMLQGSMVTSTSMLASLADSDFSEVVNNIYMLQTMAEGLLANSGGLQPVLPSLPDAAMDGTASAMVLCEEGVDYTQSELLGLITHLASPMIAMQGNSEKIDGCYFGLADGTDLCVDDKAASKLDENGQPIPFPVRERPWYTGAIEADGLYFTGIIRDAFTDRLVVTCSIPIKRQAEVVGVAGLDIVLESMDSYFTDGSHESGYAYVVNDRGEIILGPEEDELFEAAHTERIVDLHTVEDGVLSAFIDRALQEGTGLTTLQLGGKDYYLVGAPMPTIGWAVLSIVDKEVTEQPELQMLETYDRINEAASARFRDGSTSIQKTTLLILLVLLLIGISAAMVASKKIVQPIERMTENIARSARTGELFQMDDGYRTNDEIELLAEAFDDLSKKTKQYIGQITQITAEKERITTELSLAKQIQAAMLPHIFPPFPDRKEIDLYASMTPAKEVGGDFYDFFLIDEDHLCLVMADVSGKGIPAALFMMICKTILQSCAMLGQSPAEILTKTNEAICSNNQVDMFVTVWTGILEISTGKLRAANAGHEYPALKRADGRFELLKDKHGLVIGAMNGVKYSEYELQLQPGDKLFVYTDGVPEAIDADNRAFGTGRMLEALNRDPEAGPQALLQNVHDAMDDFVFDAEQFDDITMLGFIYHGTEERTMRKTMTLDAAVANLDQALAFVDEALEQLDCPMKQQMQVDLAVEEAFVNVANYAYGDQTGPVTLDLEAEEETGWVTITLRDSGMPFNPLERDDPDLSLPAEERAIGGLGIFMVKKNMDEVSYAYENGQNILTMRRHIGA